MKQMESKLKDVDCVIEVHDARVNVKIFILFFILII